MSRLGRPGRHLGCLLTLGLLAATTTSAATLTPDTTADEFDLVTDGDCSLREAIESTNRREDFGGCVATGGPYGDDLIVLEAAVYSLELGPPEVSVTWNDWDNGVGDLDVWNPFLDDVPTTLVIRGSGRDQTTIERAPTAEPFRVLEIAFPRRVEVTDLTVRGGIDTEGGGIRSACMGCRFERLGIRDNLARGGTIPMGGGFHAAFFGFSLRDSLVVDNMVEADEACTWWAAGGGVSMWVASVLATDEVRLGERVVEGTTLAGNRAIGNADCPALGGGLFEYFIRLGDPLPVQTLRLVDSTVSGNLAEQGGGVFVFGHQVGRPVELEHVTLTDNEATETGGGLFVWEIVPVPGVPTVELANTIVAGNHSPGAPDCALRDTATVLTAGVNLLGNDDPGPDTACTPASTDLVGSPTTPLDPGLLPLADYGGPTPTHALPPGSIAVDAAPGLGSATDQRGVPRPQRRAFDIGAFELERVEATEIPTTDLGGLLLLGLALAGLALRAMR